MANSPRLDPPDGRRLTLVVIPAHGGSLFQWKLSAWFLVLLAVVFGTLVSVAAVIVSRDAKGRIDYAKAAELRAANEKVAIDLARGRDTLMRVSKLELELRRMLKFHNEKALLKGLATSGGPSEEDAQHLGELLDNDPQEAVSTAESSMVDLMQAASEREKRFDEIRRYVQKKSTLLASRPTGWPVKGWISSGFGERNSPLTGKEGFHTGVDIANDMGSPIHATADGEVAYAGWEGGYGKLVIVRHGNGYATYYGHLSELRTSVGKPIKRGDVVGLMGATGNTTGPHLHYEVRVFGAAVNPVKYLQD
jgi:murein DD-endopeptidase MepM/ murein hydrolase activator NlpD